MTVFLGERQLQEAPDIAGKEPRVGGRSKKTHRVTSPPPKGEKGFDQPPRPGEGPFGLGPVGEEGLGCQPGGPPHFLEGGRPLDVTVLLPWALFIVLRAHGLPTGECLGAQLRFAQS